MFTRSGRRPDFKSSASRRQLMCQCEKGRRDCLCPQRKLIQTFTGIFFVFPFPSCPFPASPDSFPARFGGVHFVNQPWYIHALYTLIKPFLKDKTRKRIFLHGNNLNSLHQLIHPECLPSEFGGTLPPYDMGTWARTLLGPDYSDENEYTHTSYNAMHVKHASSNLEREASPKPMKSVTLALALGSSSNKSQSVVEAGTLKHEDQGESENTQPLLALD
ncbi:hypothetical protein Nmel_001382 [Mimus melanotis]